MNFGKGCTVKNYKIYRNDFQRFRAKVYYKMRWLYVNYLQSYKKQLVFYKAYRKYKKTGMQRSSQVNKTVYMTKIVNPSAGIGDQLASWITGYYYAGMFGVKYAYAPLFPKKWNEFLGFNKDEITYKELLKEENYQRIWLPNFDDKSIEDIKLTENIIKTYVNKKVVFFLELNQVYTEQIGVVDYIKKKFYAAPARKKESLKYKVGELHIALHVRRGDIVAGPQTDDDSLAFRWLDNEYYVRILEVLLKICDGNKTGIYVFSQGTEKDFPEFHKFKNIVWCMDMSATESFLHMVRADILIASKSSFSYKPALLSEGIKIAPVKFWHSYPDDDMWILADDDGNFDVGKLQSAIKNFMVRGS